MLAISLLVGSSGFMLTTPPLRATAPVARAEVPEMSWIQGNDMFARNMRKMMSVFEKPSEEDIYDFCRDEESSGCDLDMLDELAKQKPSKAKPTKYRWSAEIDDAVVKPE
jgi:hypothetical protein